METGVWGPALDEVEPVKEYVQVGARWFHGNITSEVMRALLPAEAWVARELDGITVLYAQFPKAAA